MTGERRTRTRRGILPDRRQNYGRRLRSYGASRRVWVGAGNADRRRGSDDRRRDVDDRRGLHAGRRVGEGRSIK